MKNKNLGMKLYYSLVIVMCDHIIFLCVKMQDKCCQQINILVAIRKVATATVFGDQIDNKELFDEKYRCIEQYIKDEKHFSDRDINLDKVVRCCHLSKKDVMETLRYKQNQTLSAYIKKMRIEYGCSLLLDPSNMTVDAVAEASGFGNARTFVRNFRNMYHMSPSQYRRIQKLKKVLVR